MGYEHIFCGWSKRLKPNESRRALIRSAGLRFAEMLTSALGREYISARSRLSHVFTQPGSFSDFKPPPRQVY
jgi:hypothetical protein